MWFLLEANPALGGDRDTNELNIYLSLKIY